MTEKPDTNAMEPPDIRDPVCGMRVQPLSAKGGCINYRGTDYYFCSTDCAQKFRAHPERYPSARPAAPGTGESLPAGPLYTCPTHLQVRRNVPGHCPFCGQDLKPVDPANESKRSCGWWSRMKKL